MALWAVRSNPARVYIGWHLFRENSFFLNAFPGGIRSHEPLLQSPRKAVTTPLDHAARAIEKIVGFLLIKQFYHRVTKLFVVEVSLPDFPPKIWREVFRDDRRLGFLSCG
jgi:hypothetical protein